MGTNFTEFKDMQLDILKEVGNIGAGHAATALSEMIQKPIDMNVPNVKIISLQEIQDYLGGEEKVVVGIFLRIDGDIPGNMLFTWSLESATEMLRYLLNKEIVDFNDLSEIDISALKEVGNILAGSYLSSLADFTKLNLQPTVPLITVDMVGAILSFGLIQISQYSDYGIVIETIFLEDMKQVEGHFFLIPDPDSFNNLFTALGVSL